MIPIITGVIASSVTGINVYGYNGSSSCDNTLFATAYTTSPILGVGVKLYVNPQLTIEYTDPVDGYGTLFKTSGVVYLLGEFSEIATTYNEIQPTTNYNGCGSSGVQSIIYIDGAVIPGTSIYTTCYADSSYYASGGTYFTGPGYGDSIINVDANGGISSSASCST